MTVNITRLQQDSFCVSVTSERRQDYRHAFKTELQSQGNVVAFTYTDFCRRSAECNHVCTNILPTFVRRTQVYCQIQAHPVICENKGLTLF